MIDHIEGPDECGRLPHRGVFADVIVEWEVDLPGYPPDAGYTGTMEAHVSGWVQEDGEIEDFEAVDSSGRHVDLPTSVEEQADALLIEAAAAMGG